MGNATGVASKVAGSSYKKSAAGVIVEAVEKYQVLAVSVADTVSTILGASGLPAIGAAHAVYTALYVDSLSPKQDDNGQRWVIDVHYGRNPSSGTGYSTKTVEYGNWGSTEDLVADQGTGAAILNAAGDPFDAAIQVQRQYRQWVIRLHKSSGSISTYMAQSDTVNQNAVTMPDGTSIAARGGYMTVDVTDPPGGGFELALTIRQRIRNVLLDGVNLTNIGWDEAILEQGFFFIDGDGNKVRYMEQEMDANGSMKLDEAGAPVLRPSAKPCLLAATGHLNTGVPIFKRVQVYPEASWSLT